MTKLSDMYRAKNEAGELSFDPAQAEAVKRFEKFAEKFNESRGGWNPFRKRKSPGGLYLWGGVGRGKSMLMDLFIEGFEVPKKRRVHFHEFMQEVHFGMAQARADGKPDALAPVADRMIRETDVLALDEMQISDIADAMIVGRLFERLIDGGVAVLTTSNRHPSDLYKHGLNRMLFTPFIELMLNRLDVFELKSWTDYRQHHLKGSPAYFTPADDAAAAKIDEIWRDLTNDQDQPLELMVKGRSVVIPRFHNGAGRAHFADLCQVPLGAADYLAVAAAVRMLMIEDIPILNRDNFDAAKRFVTLIDALYEAEVRLIATAAANPEELYVKGEGSFEFERTASRLREMQGEDWAKSED